MSKNLHVDRQSIQYIQMSLALSSWPTWLRNTIMTSLYLLILIGCDGNERSDVKHSSIESAPAHGEHVSGLYNMDTWLVLVHRIQHQLLAHHITSVHHCYNYF